MRGRSADAKAKSIDGAEHSGRLEGVMAGEQNVTQDVPKTAVTRVRTGS